MRYKLELSYKGTNYHGWQRQPNAISVQQVIEDAINLIFRDNIEIVGCGRTDTGVHAKFYTAHFDSNKKYTEQDIKKLNKFLAQDIAINSITKVDEDFHARFSAKERSYIYHITQTKNPFNTEFAWLITKNLNVELMNKAIKKLYDYTDFTSFSKLHTDVKTNNCKIINAEVLKVNSDIFIKITADRFLRDMIRAITGTLVNIGKEKISIKEFCEIIEEKKRSKAGQSAPAHGLFLVDVKY
ncbi:MAG: tRNA pseudouridine(38-40) synthase TruA [Bacteroidales bacterium]|nr:tRNA pseudouridine(38-40) synthase TruA [Bacteroidales bacterium]